MHYTKDYGNLSEPEKSKQAIADIIDYIGQERFDVITEQAKLALIHENMSLEHFGFMLSFAGISGGFPSPRGMNTSRIRL